MMKNDEGDHYGQKMIFCGSKKTMMPSESRENFFIISLRLVRPSIAESFSFAAEGHCIGGRFPVELPTHSFEIKENT
jgi:hypothetical protein